MNKCSFKYINLSEYRKQIRKRALDLLEKHKKLIASANISKAKKRLLYAKLIDCFCAWNQIAGIRSGRYIYGKAFGVGKRTIYEFNQFKEIWKQINDEWHGFIGETAIDVITLSKVVKNEESTD